MLNFQVLGENLFIIEFELVEDKKKKCSKDVLGYLKTHSFW